MQIGRLDAQHSHLPDQLHFGEILNVGISWNFIRDCQEPWNIDSQLISSNWGHRSGQHWRLFSHWRHFWDCRAWFKGGTEMGQGGCRPASNVKSKFEKIYSFSSLKLLHIENSHARVVGCSIWFTTQTHSAFVQVAAARWSLQPGTKCWARGSDRALVGGIWCQRRCLWCPWTAKRGVQIWTAKEGPIMCRVLDLSSIYCSFRIWQGLLWVYFGSIWGLQGRARMLVRKRRSDRKSSVLWNGTVFHRQTLVDSLSSVKNPSSWEFASGELVSTWVSLHRYSVQHGTSPSPFLSFEAFRGHVLQDGSVGMGDHWRLGAHVSRWWGDTTLCQLQGRCYLEWTKIGSWSFWFSVRLGVGFANLERPPKVLLGAGWALCLNPGHGIVADGFRKSVC